jgi:vacuolar-type H+-ATPase subunit D/Vma8
MNLEERRKELEKHIKYIEMVLEEKKGELFCLNAEIEQQKEKGA